jgi:putative addiction module component (TIGR02574 family)
MSAATLLPDILQLSVAERIQLAGAIWESIDADDQPIQLTEAQKREIDRRLADRAANPGAGESWESIKAELLGD